MTTKYKNPLTLPANDAVPEKSAAILEGVKKKYGFIPNLMKAFSASPAVLEAYLTISTLVSKTSFSEQEQHAAALIISAELNCNYCLAAHGTIGQSVGLDKDVIVALQTGAEINDSRLEALRTLLLSVVETRGYPEAEAIETFKAAGYNDTHLAEAVLLVTWKTLSNYTNHLYDTPIDDAFAANAAPELCSTDATACCCA